MQISCPHCQRQFTVSEVAIGKRATCKGCNQKFTVQRPGSTIADALVPKAAKAELIRPQPVRPTILPPVQTPTAAPVYESPPQLGFEQPNYQQPNYRQPGYPPGYQQVPPQHLSVVIQQPGMMQAPKENGFLSLVRRLVMIAGISFIGLILIIVYAVNKDTAPQPIASSSRSVLSVPPVNYEPVDATVTPPVAPPPTIPPPPVKQIPIQLQVIGKTQQEGKYQQQYVELEVRMHNSSSRDVRAFTGYIRVNDLFDKSVILLKAERTEPIVAGKSTDDKWSYSYNQFIPRESKLYHDNFEDLKFSFELDEVIYVDNGREKFGN